MQLLTRTTHFLPKVTHSGMQATPQITLATLPMLKVTTQIPKVTLRIKWGFSGSPPDYSLYHTEHNLNGLGTRTSEPLVYQQPAVLRGYDMPRLKYQNVDFDQRVEDYSKISGDIQHTKFSFQSSKPVARLEPLIRTPTDSRVTQPVNLDSDANQTFNWSESSDDCTVDKSKPIPVFPDSTTQPPERKPEPESKNRKQNTGVKIQKPPETYMILIAKAILACSSGRACLSGIYEHIMSEHSFYRETSLSWRNAVRHNLSTNECFVKAGRMETGRGYYWAIHPSCVDAFRKGNFDRRQARRKAQHANRTSEQTEMKRVSISHTLSASYSLPLLSAACRMLLPAAPFFCHVTLNWSSDGKRKHVELIALYNDNDLSKYKILLVRILFVVKTIYFRINVIENVFTSQNV